jgi:2-pyrone-4,6-dicarboxylate lactonase
MRPTIRTRDRSALMPDAGRLYELLHDWTPDADTRRRILVSNAAQPYGFTD